MSTRTTKTIVILAVVLGVAVAVAVSANRTAQPTREVLIEGQGAASVTLAVRAVGGEVIQELPAIHAVAAKLTDTQIKLLSARKGLTVHDNFAALSTPGNQVKKKDAGKNDTRVETAERKSPGQRGRVTE